MAATNVQAFSGDVTISSNLVVDTNTLFVDSVNSRVGIGSAAPATLLHLSSKTGDPLATEGDVIGAHNLTEYLRFTGQGDVGDINSVSVGFKVGADDNSVVVPYGRLDICVNNAANGNNEYGAIPDKTVATFLGSGFVGIGTTNPIGTLSVIRDTVVADSSTFQRGMFYKDGKLQITPSDLYSGYPLNGDFLTTTRYLNNGTTDFTGAAFGVEYVTTGSGGSSLYFKTASSQSSLTEKVRITDTGNVGIGANTPERKLHIWQSAANVPLYQRIQNVHNNAGCGIELMRGDGTTFGATAYSDWRINNSANLDFGVKYTGYDIPSVLHLNTSGRVSIGGVAGPTAKLEVHNSATAANAAGLVADFTGPWIRVGDARTARTFSGGMGIKFYDAGSTHMSMGIKNGVFKIGATGSDGDSLFPGGGADQENTLCITTAGNVGIGTTTPSASFHNNGNKAIINGQASFQTMNVYKTAGGNTGVQTRRYYRVYVPNGYANFQIILRGFGRNYTGSGDIQDWRRQYTVQRNHGAGLNISHDSGEDINATGFTFAVSQTGNATQTIEVHFDVTFPNKPQDSTYITFIAELIGDTGYFAENTSV